LKLRMAGVEVVEPEKNGPVLNVILTGLKLETTNAIVYGVHITLDQGVRMMENPNKVFGATTWKKASIGWTPCAKVSAARDDMKDIVDKFLNDYLAVNPKK
jgi:hypothetical protein